MDLDRVPRETSSTPASSTTTSSTSAAETSAAESNSATQDALVDVGGVEAAEPASSTLSDRQVGVLANFGIGPENLDDEAQVRMAHAIGRLDGMLACMGGDETACAALGPGPINLSDASSADGTEQEILLEEADYTLSLKVSTDPLTGETTSRLLYIDADGTYISGLSNQPVENLFAPEPTPEAGAPAEVAPDASPEEQTWLNTLADLDADYHVLARLGGAMQAYGAASDLAVAVPLLLAPEPTMLTKVAAAGAGLRGLDDLQAGVRTLISGEPTETVTQTLATEVAVALGADPEAAKTIGLGADMVTGLLNPAGRLRHMTSEASERLAREAAEQAGRHSDDAKRGLQVAEEGAERATRESGEQAATHTDDVAAATTRGAAPGQAAVVDERKFEYLFGNATGRKHNLDRTLQNKQQMARLGLRDLPEHRAILREHLEAVGKDPSSVAQTFSNEFGSYEIRESLFAGPSGQFALFESTWQVMSDGTRRLTTLIPKGG